jgi:excisionase family DNA binding protein
MVARITESAPRFTSVPGSPALSGSDLGAGLMDFAQASKYLGTSERHLRRLWQERRLSAVKVGRKVRFSRGDLDAYIEARRQRAVH